MTGLFILVYLVDELQNAGQRYDQSHKVTQTLLTLVNILRFLALMSWIQFGGWSLDVRNLKLLVHFYCWLVYSKLCVRMLRQVMKGGNRWRHLWLPSEETRWCVGVTLRHVTRATRVSRSRDNVGALNIATFSAGIWLTWPLFHGSKDGSLSLHPSRVHC